MKSYAKVAAMAVVSNAAINSCGVSDFSVAVKGFFQGMQIDPTNTATACYARTTNMMQKFDEAAASFYGPNYDY